MVSIERVHDLQERIFRFKLGDSWNLLITMHSDHPERVQIGLQWRDSQHYAHAEFFDKSEVANALRELGIINADVSSERSDSRATSSEELSLHEGDGAKPAQSEETQHFTPWGESSGRRRSELSARDLGYDDNDALG